MPRISEDVFNQEKERIDQDIQNTLDRVVNDYSEHWKGVIGEWIQNAYDGWCHNRFGRGVISEDQPLHIVFEVDINQRQVRLGDDAGGMPSDTFYHNFAGLDTPGEEKVDGEFGGSYGRGSHVIAGVGDEMYAETHHDGWRGGLFLRDAYQVEHDAELGFTDQGTVVEVYDTDLDPLLKLGDWDRVRSYIQRRFQRLLENDDVTVEYIIDGDSHIVEPVNLSLFDVLWEGDLSFTHRGSEFTLHDVRIYDKTSADTAVPLKGVGMLKSNQYVSEPFMRVQEYRPRQLRHLDKMFGFCDASELCPEYEDNAHNSFTGNVVSSTPLKNLLERLEREHFIGTPTDLDAKDEIVDTTLEIVNRQWERNPFDDDTSPDVDIEDSSDIDTEDEDDVNDTRDDEDSQEDTANDESQQTVEDTDDIEEAEPTDTSDSDALEDPADPDPASDDDLDLDDIDIDWAEDDEEDDDEEADEETEADNSETDHEHEELTDPSISCSTRSRSFNSDEDIEIWVFVENPSTSRTTEFTIKPELQHEQTGEMVDLDPISLSVPPGESSTGDHSWTVSPDQTGKYLFRAYLYQEGDDIYSDDWNDRTNTWFWVGRDARADEETPDTVTFLEDVFLVRKEDEDFRAELNEGETGMILVANTRHPEYKHAVREDGRTGTENQILTLIRWANEAIMYRLLLDEFDARLADTYADSGEPMSQTLGDFVRGTLIEELSTLTADAHNEVAAND